MLGSRPQVGPVGANPVDGYSVSQAELDAENAYNQRWGQEGMKWYNALSPQDQAAHDAEVAAHNAKISKQGKIIKPLALATIAAAGMGAGSQAFGGLEGLFGGGAEAAGGSNLGGTGIMAEGGMFSPEMLSLDQAMSLSSQMPTTSFGGFSGTAAPAAGIGSGFEGTGLMSENGMFSPELMPIDQGMQVASNMPTTDIGGAWAGGGGSSSNSLFSKLREMLPSGPTEALKMAGSLGGLYSNYQSNRNFSNLASNLAGLYGPGSAYEEQLRKELQRRDAAAGRRSQYGPRAVELQARLAQLASGQAPTLMGIYGQENASRNNMINSGLKLADQMGIWGKLASLFGN